MNAAMTIGNTLSELFTPEAIEALHTKDPSIQGIGRRIEITGGAAGNLVMYLKNTRSHISAPRSSTDMI